IVPCMRRRTAADWIDTPVNSLDCGDSRYARWPSNCKLPASVSPRNATSRQSRRAVLARLVLWKRGGWGGAPQEHGGAQAQPKDQVGVRGLSCHRLLLDRLRVKASHGDRVVSASACESLSASRITSAGTHAGNARRRERCAPLGVCSFQPLASCTFRKRGASFTSAGHNRR